MNGQKLFELELPELLTVWNESQGCIPPYWYVLCTFYCMFPNLFIDLKRWWALVLHTVKELSVSPLNIAYIRGEMTQIPNKRGEPCSQSSQVISWRCSSLENRCHLLYFLVQPFFYFPSGMQLTTQKQICVQIFIVWTNIGPYCIRVHKLK